MTSCASPLVKHTSENGLESWLPGETDAWKKLNTFKVTKTYKYVRKIESNRKVKRTYLLELCSRRCGYIYLTNNYGIGWLLLNAGEVFFVARLRRDESFDRNLKGQINMFIHSKSLVRLADLENLLGPLPNRKTKQNINESPK